MFDILLEGFLVGIFNVLSLHQISLTRRNKLDIYSCFDDVASDMDRAYAKLKESYERN